MKPIVERFFRYIKIDTQSTWEAESVPASKNEFVLGDMLVKELQEMGVSDAYMDDKAYVYAKLPSNMEQSVPSVAFLAHLDTAPDESGANVNPRIIENWDGSDIRLCEDRADAVLSIQKFPSLAASVGKDLIVTDGHSLLGADDKAGVAEIMEAVRYLCEHPEIKHGDVYIGFTPDEEIGNSTQYFNIRKLPADYGYTMDGGELGEVNFENFNAATATISIQGLAIHPGESKGRMKNAVLLANAFLNCLPPLEIPANSENYEGFYHVTDIRGSVDHAELVIALRDFTDEGYEYKKKRILEIADYLNAYYGAGTFTAKVEDYYLNMDKEIRKHPKVKDHVLKAMEMAGVEPVVTPIRGGTDGSDISFMGMPCPNIFMGSANSHSIYEYCTVQSMEKASEIILNIIQLFAADTKD